MNYLALGLQFHKTQKIFHKWYVLQPYFVHFSSLNSATAGGWTHPDQSLSLHSRLHIEDVVVCIAKICQLPYAEK